MEGAGNVISGNGENGVVIHSGPDNRVQGNRIGTNARGTAAVPNGEDGVQVYAQYTNIWQNQISGNPGRGIWLHPASGNSTIWGNTVGSNADGTAAIGNRSGIQVGSATNTRIGGTVEWQRNLIMGNPGGGIGVFFFPGEAATNPAVTIRGNTIRDNDDETGDGIGIAIGDAANVVVGGTLPTERNFITGNGYAGISLRTSTDVTIQG
jgi:parallel beta-helix repeat protein